MERASVVEDAEQWQNFHRSLLEPILGKERVDVVTNYDDAISMLGQDYKLYILDVQFPRYRLGRPQLLGIQLAQEIMRRKGSSTKIIVVSSHMPQEAQNMGITRIYNKYSFEKTSRRAY